MKRFTFRLDALKRMAAADESLEQIELAKRLRALEQAEQRVEEVEALAELARTRFQGLLDEGAPAPGEISRGLDALDDTTHFVDRAKGERDTRRGAAEQARERLEEHVTRRRILERLEVRARRVHARDVERETQREMDENAGRWREETAS